MKTFSHPILWAGMLLLLVCLTACFKPPTSTSGTLDIANLQPIALEERGQEFELSKDLLLSFDCAYLCTGCDDAQCITKCKNSQFPGKCAIADVGSLKDLTTTVIFDYHLFDSTGNSSGSSDIPDGFGLRTNSRLSFACVEIETADKETRSLVNNKMERVCYEVFEPTEEELAFLKEAFKKSNTLVPFRGKDGMRTTIHKWSENQWSRLSYTNAKAMAAWMGKQL
ncbi:MAG: hypothetical protein AAFQ68_16870 [Bacteroidota bacterium]